MVGRVCASDPGIVGQLRVGALEQAAQRLARRILALLDERFVLEVGGRAEQRLERRVHVGVDERQPTVHLGAAPRRTVAAEPGITIGSASGRAQEGQNVKYLVGEVAIKKKI